MNQETVKYGETFRCRFVYIIFELHSNTFWRLKRNISGKILAYHISLPMYGGDYFLKNNEERTLCEHTLSPVVFASQMKMITFLERLCVNYEKINYY